MARKKIIPNKLYINVNSHKIEYAKTIKETTEIVLITPNKSKSNFFDK